MNTAARNAIAEGTTGILDYMDTTVESSLYRNGKVFTRRDAHGSDAGWQGVNRRKLQLPIRDARALAGASRQTLAHNGHELLDRQPSIDGIDFLDHFQVVTKYYPLCAEAVRAFTGAKVFAFDHNVRSAAGKQNQQRIAGGQQVQGPAHMVHGDYTLTSAPQRLHDLTQPPKTNDTLRAVLGEGQSLIRPEEAKRVLGSGGRFAIINVWRNIAQEPVATHPMAFCDAQTVRTEDLVVFEIQYQDRIGENYFSKHSPGHAWYYYPQVRRDEAILIKQWDSAGPLARSQGARADGSDPRSPCSFSFHTAFEDPATPPDAPDRWSIEVRCFALYD